MAEPYDKGVFPILFRELFDPSECRLLPTPSPISLDILSTSSWMKNECYGIKRRVF